MGNHVADNGIDLEGAQPFQDRRNFIGTVDGFNQDIHPEQVAKRVGVAGDTRKSNNSQTVCIILGQVDGPEDVVDLDRDFNHRDLSGLLDEIGGAAPGKNGIVKREIHIAQDFHTLFKVSGKNVQPDIRKAFGTAGQRGNHGFVRRNGQDPDGIPVIGFHKIQLPAFADGCLLRNKVPDSDDEIVS